MIGVHVREGRIDVDRILAGGQKIALQRDHTLEAANLCWQSDLVESSRGIEPERQTEFIAKREFDAHAGHPGGIYDNAHTQRRARLKSFRCISLFIEQFGGYQRRIPATPPIQLVACRPDVCRVVRERRLYRAVERELA